MIKFSSFLYFSLIVNFLFGVAVQMPKRYEFQDVLIEPIRPSGLRISIPNLDINMKRFSFHGNIGDEIDVADNGTINSECFMEINGRWTIIFEKELIFQNDIINYWFEVQINNYVYRYRDRNYTVKNLIHLSNSIITPFTSNCNLSESNQNECKYCNGSVVPGHTLEITFQKRFESVIKDVEILKKLFYEHIQKSTNTKLVLIGIPSALIPNATEAIQHFLTDQLQYFSGAEKIHQANKTKCGIVFDMDSDIDKKIILFRAFDILNNTDFKILDYENYNCSTETSEIRSSPIIRSTEIIDNTENEPIKIYFPRF